MKMKLLSARHAITDFVCCICGDKAIVGAMFIAPRQDYIDRTHDAPVCLVCLNEARRIARTALPRKPKAMVGSIDSLMRKLADHGP